ncbi:hypothetical protein D3C74_84790 [compost metagenome]
MGSQHGSSVTYTEQHMELVRQGLQAIHLIEIDPELLPDAIYALGLTFNADYIPIVTSFDQHEQPAARTAAAQALIELARKQE